MIEFWSHAHAVGENGNFGHFLEPRWKICQFVAARGRPFLITCATTCGEKYGTFQTKKEKF